MAAAAIVQVALQGQPALNLGEQITATQRLGGVISPRSAAAKVVNGVCSYVTQRFDIGRTGWNQYESLLTVNSVLSGFAAIATLTVQGEVAAQPLYLRGLTIGGKQRNIVFVATTENYIYAFDADTFEQIWRQQLTPTNPSYPYASNWAYNGSGGGGGESGWDDIGYNRTIGIMGTPVIDPKAQVAYLVVTCQNIQYQEFTPITQNYAPAGSVLHWLYAIDLTTGNTVAGIAPNPTQLQPTVGAIAFDSRVQMQRPGLLLANGNIYVGFGSYGDKTSIAQYYGWVLIYAVATLNEVAVFFPCPDAVNDKTAGKGGSIWQSGTGIAADANGNVYFATANGDFEPAAQGSGAKGLWRFGHKAFTELGVRGPAKRLFYTIQSVRS